MIHNVRMRATVFAFVATTVVIAVAMLFAFTSIHKAYGEDPEITAAVMEYTPTDAGFTDNGFTMNGGWAFPSAASTCNDGDSVSYTGTFTRFIWYGEANDNAGPADVFIDGEKVITIKNNRGESGNNCVMYESEILERGQHTFKLECRGGGWMSVGKIVIIDDPFVAPHSEIIDDADERIAYTSYAGFDGQTGLYNGTVHSARENGATASLKLDGVRQFVVYSDRVWNRGKAAFYIDNEHVETVDMYNGADCGGSHPVFVSDVLNDGTHELKIVCLGEKNKNATEEWIAVDKIAAYYHSAPIPPEPTFDIDDASIGFEGVGWTAFNGLDSSYYMRSAHSTDRAGESFCLPLIGVTSIQIHASLSNDRGTASVYLNGEYAGDIDEYSPHYQSSGVVWDSGELEKGDYELKVVTTGEKQPDSGNTWVEIDKIRVKGIEGENMIIHSANGAFITYTSGVKLEENAAAKGGKFANVGRGESFVATFRGSLSSLVPFDNGRTWKIDLTVDGEKKEYTSQDVGDSGIVLELGDAVMHRLTLTVTEGEFAFDYITTDDLAFVSLEADMRIKALDEIAKRVDGTREVSDPAMWQPVEFAANKPTGGVTLKGGILGDMFDKNTTYFKNSIKKTNYVDVTEWWVSMLQNSNEGRVLAGLANTLNWKSVPEFETELSALLNRIRARQEQNGNGYALSYDESVLGGNSDPSEDERRNYDRAMFVKGLVAAGDYYNNKGVAVKDNIAYTILREFMDWYNYNPNKYGEHMLEGVVGVQGHPASTKTYFTPVGKTEDMTYAELCYIQDWWIEYLTGEIPEAIYKYPLNRPHNYLMTGVDSYLDHYRATGDVKYLNACLGYWNMMHEFFIHDGGAAAICEFNTYLPGSRHLDSGNHTGELCGTAFWVDFNYKLLQLFPNEEKYALEVEKGIYNIMREAQDAGGKLRYHQRYNGKIEVALNTNTCCEINGSNLLSRLPEFIYLLEDDGVRVNLYDSAALDATVGGKHYALTQTANILTGDVSVIKITGDGMKLTLRVPSWAKSFAVKVNGKAAEISMPIGGGYVTLEVETGDEVEVTAAKELSAVDYDGLTQVEGKTRHAFMYGPVLMATVIDPDSYYEFKFKVHGKDTDGTDESAIDLNMSLEDFMKGLKSTGNGRWAYETNGETPFKIIPYGELESNMFFSTYPLFGYTKEQPTPPVETVDGETLDVKFDGNASLDKFDVYSSTALSSAVIENGALITSGKAEQKFLLKGSYNHDAISVKMKIRLTRGRDINAGIYFNASRPSGAQDKINALNLQAESSGNTVKFSLYGFDADNGYTGLIFGGSTAYITGTTLELELVIKGGKLYGYVNGVATLEYTLEDRLGMGMVGIRSQHSATEITEFAVTNSEVKPDQPIDPVDPVEKEKYKIVVMNGTNKIYDKTIEKDGAISFTPPRVEGYAFDGLYKDAAFTEEAIMPETATENLTLYAKYVKLGDGQTPTTPPVTENKPEESGLPVAAIVAIACVIEAVIFAAATAAYVLIKKKKSKIQ